MLVGLFGDKNDCSWKLCLLDNGVIRFVVRFESCEKCVV